MPVIFRFTKILFMIRSLTRRPWMWMLSLMLLLGSLLLTWQTRLTAARATDSDSELSLRFQQYQLRPLEALDLCVPVQRPLPDSLHAGSPFGMRHHPILNMYIQHEGVDFGAPVGTPVFATADGKVAWLTALADSSTYGISVAIDHGSSPWTGEHYETRYAHLLTTEVKPGASQNVA
jgi:murein DD-endopeptidase MepM/ murein hydrolase activator NlpD